MPYNPDAQVMPQYLTGLSGEVLSLEQWPLSERAYRSGKHDGATDCIMFFDKIRAGGKYNSRRVYYSAGRFYVRYSRAKRGVVYIRGVLALDVLDIVSEVYTYRGVDV